MKIENIIYFSSPVFLQHFYTSLYGWKREINRYGGNFKKYVNHFLETQFYSKDELYSYQLNRLKKLLEHCYRSVPYYRRCFDKIGFDPSRFSSLDELKKIPVLTKEEVRIHIEDLVAKNFKRKELSEYHTSGTTGKSLKAFFTIENFREKMALIERQRIWAGVKCGDRIATFTGKIITSNNNPKTFWRYNLFGRQLYFSTYHLSDKYLKKYIDALIKFKPIIIEGYPSAIYILAQWVDNNQYKMDLQTKAIFTTGETLLDYQREKIEHVFQTKVYNYYASSEGAPFITQCEHGGLHLNLDSGIFEILDNNMHEVNNEGELGELIVTCFSNEGTPLIRYKINDTVTFSKKQCACGRNFPLVEKIIGRVDDLLFTKERGYIGRLSPAIKAFPNDVIEVQFVQNGLDEIDLYIIPDKNRFKEEHLKTVLKEIHQRVGESVRITPKIVDKIPRGSNNKYRLTIRNFEIPI